MKKIILLFALLGPLLVLAQNQKASALQTPWPRFTRHEARLSRARVSRRRGVCGHADDAWLDQSRRGRRDRLPSGGGRERASRFSRF